MLAIRLAAPLALVFASVLAGCGRRDGVERDLREFETHLDAMGREVDAHAVVVDAASDLAAIETAEASHDLAVEEHMAGMRHEIDDMGGCIDEDGTRPDTKGMTQHMGDMAGECADHRGAMKKAADTPGARAEEHRHLSAMHGMIDRMRADADGMMNDGGGMMGNHECGEDMHGM